MALIAFSLLPVNWGRWVNTFHDVATWIFGPVQKPVYQLSRWFVSPPSGPDDTRLRELENDRALFQAMYLKLRDDLVEANRRLARYEAGLAPAESGVRFMLARVIGPTGDAASGIIKIRAGRSEGVEERTVATVAGVQIVGRVERVQARSADIVLITDRAVGPLEAVIVPDDNDPDKREIRCPQLYPLGDGTLQGMVQHEPARQNEPSPTPKVGQLVRLRDASWPANSRMLVIGRVESVNALFEAPLRHIVVVRPTVPLDRVTEVTLRLVVDPAGGVGGGGTP